MNKKKFLVIAGLALLIAAPAAALAHGGCRGFGSPMFGGAPSMPPPFMMLLRTANLTTDQQAQVQKILDSNRGQVGPLFKQLHAIREQIADKLLTSGTVDESGLQALQKQAGQIHGQIDASMLSTAIAVRGVLTSDQLTKLADVHTQLKSIHAQIKALLNDNGAGDGPAGPPPE